MPYKRNCPRKEDFLLGMIVQKTGNGNVFGKYLKMSLTDLQADRIIFPGKILYVCPANTIVTAYEYEKKVIRTGLVGNSQVFRS